MTFADTYNIRSSQLSAANIANALDALVADAAFVFATSLINTTSTSLTDYTSMSTSLTTESGQSIVVLADLRLSHGTDQQAVTAEINIDSSTAVTRDWSTPVGNTAGNIGTLPLFYYVAAPSVGSHTIKLRWKVNSGTGYSLGAAILALALRTG